MKEDRNSLRQSLLCIIALLLCSLAMVSVEANTLDNQPPAGSEESAELDLMVTGASAGITTDYFEQALLESIENTGIFPSIHEREAESVTLPMIGAKGTFEGVEQQSNAPYQLKVRIIKIDAPSFSVRMKVSMNAVWNLYDKTGDRVILQENIHSTYTGGAFEGGFNGANRVRAAVEGASRENIRLGVAKLAALDLQQD